MRRVAPAILVVCQVLRAIPSLPHDTWLMARRSSDGAFTLSERIGMEFSGHVNAIPPERSRGAGERRPQGAKPICRVARGPISGFDRVTGKQREVIPIENPLTVQSGDELRVRVVFGEEFTGTTLPDSAGEAIVPSTRAGLTTLRSVHMTRRITQGHERENSRGNLICEVR